MAVFSWIVRILAALGIGAIWVFTVIGLNAATDAMGITQSLAKGLFGVLSTVLIAWFLTRRNDS